jgi:hypothetical protein
MRRVRRPGRLYESQDYRGSISPVHSGVRPGWHIARMRTEADLPEEVRSLILDGRSAADRREYSVANELLEEALTKSREIGSDFAECAALHFLGNVAFNQCRDAESREYQAAALEIARHLGDDLGIATNVGSIAMVDIVEGDFASAEANYLESIAAYERAGLTERADVVRSSLEAFVVNRVPIDQIVHREHA